MNVTELIERKRDGDSLAGHEIRDLIAAFTADRVPDYQMSAMLMAIVWRGLSDHELSAWTDAMLGSGAILETGHISAAKVDKHSTGGVGDKVSIPLAPMVSACGAAVPMMSGRGLGHTGGTLDKLESIPGFRTALDPDEFIRQLERIGLVLAGQSETLVPADRRIYALRDASGTVPSIPLISSSIMSKKLAEGLDALVLDVKVGSGAFMKNVTDARLLAETMVGIGARHGTTVHAMLTSMHQPLGAEVGNACEIVESIDVLRGSGPPDLVEIVLTLGARMLSLVGVTDDDAEGRRALQQSIDSGTAMEKFLEVVEAQGGDNAVIADPGLLPMAAHQEVVRAPRDGYVVRCDALAIGHAGVRLGAGRTVKEDDVDPGVGIRIEAKVGTAVGAGDALAVIRWNERHRLTAAQVLVEEAFDIGDEMPTIEPLILGEVT